MDPLVVPFLRAADETCARETLDALLIAHASPVVGAIVQRQLAFGGAARADHEREALQTTVLRRLTAGLWALRRGEPTTPIVSLPAYAATTAYNACHQWLRQHAPQRASLQSCSRYVLTHDPRLAFWEIADHDWCGATVDARIRGIAASDEKVRDVVSTQLAIRRAVGGASDPAASPEAFATFIRAALEALRRPCRFVTLVTVLADCLGQTDATVADGGRDRDGDGAPSRRQEEEPPSFAEIVVYVDGSPSDVDRAIFETRLESDPALRIEVDDLLMLREAMPRAAAIPASTPASAAAPEVPGAAAESTPAPASPATVSPATTSRPAVSGTAPASPAAAAAPVAASPTMASPVTTSRAAPSVTPRAAARRPRAAGRSIASRWMIAALAAASAAVVVILALTAWRGAPTRPAVPGGAAAAGEPSPPTSSPAGDSAPPTSSAGASPASAPLTPSVIAIRDAGRIITVDSGGRLQGLPDAMSARADMVTQALRAGTLPGAAAHKGLGQRELTQVAPDDPVDVLAVVAPLGTVVRELQPTFRWLPYPDARSYVVIIYSDAFDVVLSSPSVRDTTWRATSPLKPGATYLWQVTAHTPGGRVHAPTPPAPDARFRVMADDARRALDRDLATAGASRLLAGLLFANAGLLDDAEQAFTALAKENPESEPITRLLSRVRERKKTE